PDDAVRGARLGEPVVDLRPERVEREPPLEGPLRARDLSAGQTPADADLDPLGAEALARFHRLAHRAPERDALLELHRDRLADELGVDLRLVDLEDVDEDVPLRPLLDVVLEAVHLGALAADDDSRARGQDVDLELVRRPLDLDRRHAGVTEALLERLAEGQVLVEQLRVLPRGVPARAPGLVEADAEPVRVDLVTHRYLFAAARLGAAFLAAFFGAAFFGAAD